LHKKILYKVSLRWCFFYAIIEVSKYGYTGENMAESLNTKVDLTTQAIAHLGFAEYGQVMLGDKAFEFYNDRSPENNMQFPWQSIERVEGEVSKSLKGETKIGRNFYVVFHNQQKVRFSSDEAGKILKVMREYIGNDKVVKVKTMLNGIKNLFMKKNK